MELFLTLVRMQVRHWPAGRLWVDLRYPGRKTARVYRDGSWELVA